MVARYPRLTFVGNVVPIPLIATPFSNHTAEFQLRLNIGAVMLCGNWSFKRQFVGLAPTSAPKRQGKREESKRVTHWSYF